MLYNPRHDIDRIRDLAGITGTTDYTTVTREAYTPAPHHNGTHTHTRRPNYATDTAILTLIADNTTNRPEGCALALALTLTLNALLAGITAAVGAAAGWW